ncbi:cytochrome P450 [Lepidopterella palustris CBS 459.81]|uniref:Cytochrome P450 n=1 Tax=Lepidopterella palustris CBS 459.81 TaxID=1314670 RepID=A0A8E2E119_9PEZI|nr:cytochrome P450 [Lepidopterella palustris CBS 459.81]
MDSVWAGLAAITSHSEYIWAGLAAITAYTIYGAIWRLYLSPIAHFPGPRMAALTNLYEIYYNNWLGGKYIWKINEMHEQYGPIVRISPSDLHVGDPEFYDILYPSTTSGRRANKPPSLTKFFGLNESLFSTMEHDIHRMRRAALLPFFSPTYVRKLQPIFQDRLDVLLRRMADFKDTDKAVNANCMFAAFSRDIMEMLAFGQCSHRLESPEFDPSERDASLSGAQSFHVMKRVPWLNDVMMALPESLARRISPALGSYMRQKHKTRELVAQLASKSEDEWSGREMPIFRAVMDSSKLPSHEKSVERVAQDAQMLLMAGTLTMASNLEHLIYWMVDNPDVLRKLKEELRSVMPSINDVGKELGDPSKDIGRHDQRFGKGSRVCLGMPHGYGILRLVLAQIWRLWATPDVKLGDEIGVLGLYNTSPHDVQMKGDFFVGAYNKAQGVEFKVRSM